MTILAYNWVLYEFVIFICMLVIRGFLNLPLSLRFISQGQVALGNTLELLNKKYVASSPIRHELLNLVK